MRQNRPVRIANCSGFYGDRQSALAEMVLGGEVDVVTGDYLAEVTMLVLAKVRFKRPGQGYASSFLRQLEPVAGEIAERGIKVVVNAGGLDPANLAQATRELLAGLGVELSVAHIEGDDLLPQVSELAAAGELAHLDTRVQFSSWGRDALTANAYLGGFGVSAALGAGADIVVAGRVADASLLVGAAAWWWGWERGAYDELAGAVVAGHVIECGAQATGGNFSGFSSIATLDHPGFPLAEVDRDGSAVITKHEGSAGAVTVDTVTAQLLYEVGSPSYLNPDVVARLDTVRVSPDGPDRVRISGVRGSPPPATTKVAITSLGGWRNSTTLVLTGLDPDAKAELLERSVREALAESPGISDLRFVRIGVPAEDPSDQMAGSSLLHIEIDGEEASAGRPFSSLLVELALSSYPGLYGLAPPGPGAPYGAYWPALVRQALLREEVVLADGTRIEVPGPSVFAEPGSTAPLRVDAPSSPAALAAAGDDTTATEATAATPTENATENATATATEATAATPTENATATATEATATATEATATEATATDAGAEAEAETVVGPLGWLVHARSGDKGGTANLGAWVSDGAAWPWLASTLTTEALRRLLPEVAGLPIERYELANLRALNFVVSGLLDEGATEARRFDKQAKALGEWLRARHVPLPLELLRRVGPAQGVRPVAPS